MITTPSALVFRLSFRARADPGSNRRNLLVNNKQMTHASPFILREPVDAVMKALRDRWLVASADRRDGELQIVGAFNDREKRRLISDP